MPKISAYPASATFGATDYLLGDTAAGPTTKTFAGSLIVRTAQVGVANGVASLDSGGLIPAAQLPTLVIDNTYVVANQAARLALAANVGDFAKQADIGVAYILQALPASTNANWIDVGSSVTLPGGPDTAVQFNSSSAFGGSANFTWTGSLLTVNPIGATLIAPPSGTALLFCGGDGNAAMSRVYGQVFMGTGGGYIAYGGRAARGTSAAPSALQLSDEMLHLSASGYGATGYSAAARAFLSIFAAENWTDAAQGTRIAFHTTAPGGVITNEKVRIWGDGGVQIDGTFTASPGPGHINAGGAGLSSQPIGLLSGAWFAGGSATTTKPALLVEPAGTSSINWSTSGTGIGINSTASFAGNLIDIQVAAQPKFRLSSAGDLSVTNVSAAMLARFMSITPGSGGGSVVAVGLDNNAALSSGDRMGVFAFRGASAAGFVQTNAAAISAFAEAGWTGSSSPSYMVFETCPAGTLTRAERMRITSAGKVGVGVIAPTALFSVTRSAIVGGPGTSAGVVSIIGGAHTGLDASVECIGVSFDLSQTKQFNASTITLQRAISILPGVYAFTSSGTINDSNVLDIAGPASGGTNAALLESCGIHVRTAALSNTISAYAGNFDAPSGATNNRSIRANGRMDLIGADMSAASTNAIGALSITNTTLTKNDSNTRVFFNTLIKPTFNTGVSNLNTTYNVLAVDTTNTGVTGLAVNLLSLSYGGVAKFVVDSTGTVTVGNVTVASDANGNTKGGTGALASLTGSPNGNTAFGNNAGNAITGGSYSTLIGYLAGSAVAGTAIVTAVGGQAARLVTGDGVTAIGYGTISGGASSGTNNTVVGSTAGQNIAGGSGNTAIGQAAGISISSGANNVCLGAGSGATLSTGNGNVLIGKSADCAAGTNNTCVIGSQSSVVSDYWLGAGMSATVSGAGQAVDVRLTDANGSNQAGGALNLHAGRSTGNVNGGTLTLSVTPASTSGSSVNTEDAAVIIAPATKTVTVKTGYRIVSNPTATVLTSVSAATAINCDANSAFTLTLQESSTLVTPTGTPHDGQIMRIRVTQDGTGGWTLAYDAGYAFSTDLPSPTVDAGIGKKTYLIFIYDGVATKWQLLGKNAGF